MGASCFGAKNKGEQELPQGKKQKDAVPMSGAGKDRVSETD